MKPVGVMGLGVVGGTVATAFSDADVPTRGYDPGLGIGRPEDLSGCSVIFCCVPTPGTEDGSYDLSILWSSVTEARPHLEPETIVVVKSTVPPGTCDALAAAFPQIEFANVPEFLVAARPVETFTKPDRVVIGARTPEVAATLSGLMARVAPASPIIVLSPTESELVKLCANAMLAAKVSIANELAEVCARFGVDWSRVQAGVGLDRRIGPDHLTVTPERGFGGSCLPKDLDGLIAAARSVGYPPALLEEIAGFNRRILREALTMGDGVADAAATAVGRSGA